MNSSNNNLNSSNNNLFENNNINSINNICGARSERIEQGRDGIRYCTILYYTVLNCTGLH